MKVGSFSSVASLRVGNAVHGTDLYGTSLQAAATCNAALYEASHKTKDDGLYGDLAHQMYDVTAPSLSTPLELQGTTVERNSNKDAVTRPPDSSMPCTDQQQPRNRYDKRRWRRDACPLSATSKFRLTPHFSKHYNQRCFSCTVCAKAFSKSVHLIDHMRTHTGERPFRCNICLRQFTQKSAMVRHRLQVHKQGKDDQGGASLHVLHL